jgi:glycosyltransferase involved in cell wall biosynthesis
VGHHVREAVADQTGRGWRVSVASPPDADLVSYVRDRGAVHQPWAASRTPSRQTISETQALRRIVDATEPDVVHLHSSKAGLAGRLAIRGRRATLFTPHAWSFLHGGRTTRVLALRWERRAARWTSTIICVSESERNLGIDRGIRAEMVVLRNAVDLDRYAPLSKERRRAVRARIGVGDEPTAVCVGRLVEQKGQDLLVGAWPTVRSRVPDAQLLLVGEGPEHDTLAARRVDGVQLLGARTDVPELLASADVAVLASRWEGMSYVLLEAIACGTAVVASDVAGVREVLENVPGSVVPIGDVDALAAAIATKLTAPRVADPDGGAARARARAFDVRRWGDDLARVTEAAANRS